VVGDCIVIADLLAAGGPEVPGVALHIAVEGDVVGPGAPGVSPFSSGGVIAAETVLATTAPKDLVVATPVCEGPADLRDSE
jgi:hypothetical protein